MADDVETAPLASPPAKAENAPTATEGSGVASVPPQALTANLAASVSRLKPAFDELDSTAREASEQRVSVDRQFGEYLKSNNARQETVYGEINQAYSKMKNIESYPAIVTNILGLFNPDYNYEMQKTDIKRGAVQLQELDKNTQDAVLARTVAVDAIEAPVGAAKERATSAVQRLAGVSTAIDSASRLNELEEKRLGQLTHQMPLGASANDPKIAAYAQAHGLPESYVSDELHRRQQVELNIRHIDAMVDQTKAQTANLRTEDKIHNLQLIDMTKKKALEEMSPEMLEDLMKRKDANGQVQITPGGYKVPATEIQARLAQAETDRIARISAVAERSGATEALKTQGMAVATKIQDIMALDRNSSYFSPATKAEILEQTARIQAHLKAGDPVGALKIQTDQNAYMQKKVKEIIDSMGPDIKPAAQEFLELDRNISDSTAARALVNTTSNAGLHGTPFADIGTVIQDQLKKQIAAANPGAMLSGGNMTIDKIAEALGVSKQDPSSVIRNIINAPIDGKKDDTIQGRVDDVNFYRYFDDTIKKAAEGAVKRDANGNVVSLNGAASPYAALFTVKNGELVYLDKYMQPSRDGTKYTADVAKIVEDLTYEAAKDPGFRKGALNPAKSLISSLQSPGAQNAWQNAVKKTQSLTEAIVVQSIKGGQITSNFNTRVGALVGLQKGAEAKLQKSLDAISTAAAAGGTVDPKTGNITIPGKVVPSEMRPGFDQAPGDPMANAPRLPSSQNPRLQEVQQYLKTQQDSLTRAFNE